MIVLPSRGRPILLQRFFDTGKPSLPGVVVLDEDDFHKYDKVRYPSNWLPLVLPRMCISKKCNAAFEHFPSEPFYGITNDDVVPETPGWDVKLRDLAGDRNFAYGDDGIKHRYSTAIHCGELIRTVGWLLCPAVNHFYTDDAWEIMREVGLGIFAPEIKVTHLHFSTGKASFGQTYQDRGSPPEDKERFEFWRATQWPLLKERLQKAFPQPNPPQEAING